MPVEPSGSLRATLVCVVGLVSSLLSFAAAAQALGSAMPFNSQSPGPPRLDQPWFPDLSAARRFIPYTFEDGLYDILSLVHVLEIGAPALLTPVVSHLPACDSYFAVESSRNAYEGASTSRNVADTFVKLDNIKETASSRRERDCVANMVLFGGTIRVTHYRLMEIASFVAVDVRVDVPR